MKEELQKLYSEYKKELQEKQSINYHCDSKEDTLEYFFWWLLTGKLK